MVEEGAGVEVEGLIAAFDEEEEEDESRRRREPRGAAGRGHRGELAKSLSHLQMEALSSRSDPSAMRVESCVEREKKGSVKEKSNREERECRRIFFFFFFSAKVSLGKLLSQLRLFFFSLSSSYPNPLVIFTAMQTTAASMTRPSAVRNARSAAAVSHRVAPVAKRAAARGIVAQAAPSATSVKYVAKQIPGDIGEAINAVRFLSIDGVNAANSGHPGLPMGCAPMASILFSEYMKLNPEDPKWADRDRFVLSAGHGSMLQYSLLHLLGYKDMTVRKSVVGSCCFWRRLLAVWRGRGRGRVMMTLVVVVVVVVKAKRKKKPTLALSAPRVLCRIAAFLPRFPRQRRDLDVLSAQNETKSKSRPKRRGNLSRDDQRRTNKKSKPSPSG